MNAAGHSLGFLRELTWSHVLLIIAVLVGGQLLVLAVRRIVRRAAESAPSHRRLLILRTGAMRRQVIKQPPEDLAPARPHDGVGPLGSARFARRQPPQRS
jgi:hypothetical protein